MGRTVQGDEFFIHSPEPSFGVCPKMRYGLPLLPMLVTMLDMVNDVYLVPEV